MMVFWLLSQMAMSDSDDPERANHNLVLKLSEQQSEIAAWDAEIEKLKLLLSQREASTATQNLQDDVEQQHVASSGGVKNFGTQAASLSSVVSDNSSSTGVGVGVNLNIPQLTSIKKSKSVVCVDRTTK